MAFELDEEELLATRLLNGSLKPKDVRVLCENQKKRRKWGGI
jgi:hypothetical protein